MDDNSEWEEKSRLIPDRSGNNVIDINYQPPPPYNPQFSPPEQYSNIPPTLHHVLAEPFPFAIHEGKPRHNDSNSTYQTAAHNINNLPYNYSSTPISESDLPNYIQPNYATVPNILTIDHNGHRIRVLQVGETNFRALPSHRFACPIDGFPHELDKEYTLSGLLCAILCFPIGLICCMYWRQRVCVKCGQKLNKLLAAHEP